MHNYQEYLINLFHKMIMKDSYVDRNITINSQKRFNEKEKIKELQVHKEFIFSRLESYNITFRY